MLFNPLPSLLRLGFALICLLLLASYGWSLSHQDVPMDLLARQQPPSLVHWFGTDQMGRDLWLRAFQGTLTSLELGISTALCSGLLAMVAASLSLVHPRCDAAVRLVIDAMLALPHMLQTKNNRKGKNPTWPFQSELLLNIVTRASFKSVICSHLINLCQCTFDKCRGSS
nr:hypothetical protein [Bacillus subtilis]